MSELTGLALGLNQDGRLEVVATGRKGGDVSAIWHRQRHSHRGSDWTLLGQGQPSSGVFAGFGPAVARNADGRLEVAVIGEDLAVWHAWQREPGRDWTSWHSLELPGGKEVISRPEGARPPDATPALAGNADGRLEVFATDIEGAVWHCWQREPGRDWSRWRSLETPDGHAVRSGLAAAQNQDGRLELFAGGLDSGEV